MAADTDPPAKQERRGMLRSEGDQIKFIDLRFER